MNQSRYSKKILSNLGMVDCKPGSTQCEMDITKTSDEVSLINYKPYSEIIGSLIYIMVATTPDICYTVRVPKRSETKFFPFNESK